MNPQVSPEPHTPTVSRVGGTVITAAMPTQLTVTLRVTGSGLPENNKAKETKKKVKNVLKRKEKKARSDSPLQRQPSREHDGNRSLNQAPAFPQQKNHHHHRHHRSSPLMFCFNVSKATVSFT